MQSTLLFDYQISIKFAFHKAIQGRLQNKGNLSLSPLGIPSLDRPDHNLLSTLLVCKSRHTLDSQTGGCWIRLAFPL